MEELLYLLEHLDEESSAYLRAAAAEESVRHFGRKIYLRGLIEFTNYCKNDCLYCGIRRGNQNAVRYRLTLSQIMECCEMGYELGYRTFVLQGGEDAYFNDERICEIIRSIKNEYPCGDTLTGRAFRRILPCDVGSRGGPLSSAGRDIRSGALCDAASKADEPCKPTALP